MKVPPPLPPLPLPLPVPVPLIPSLASFSPPPHPSLSSHDKSSDTLLLRVLTLSRDTVWAKDPFDLLDHILLGIEEFFKTFAPFLFPLSIPFFLLRLLSLSSLLRPTLRPQLFPPLYNPSLSLPPPSPSSLPSHVHYRYPSLRVSAISAVLLDLAGLLSRRNGCSLSSSTSSFS